MIPLFIGVYPTGLVYADRTREEHGDYLTVARLPYATLEIEWSGVSVSPEMRAAIIEDAAKLQARRGEDYPISWSGATVRLGSAMEGGS